MKRFMICLLLCMFILAMSFSTANATTTYEYIAGKSIELIEGTYVCGHDLPAGRYIATASATSSGTDAPVCYVYSSADSSNAQILDTCDFDYQEQGSINLVEGNCLKIDSGSIVLTASPLLWTGSGISGYVSPVYENIAGMKVELDVGKYICGIDLPAGRYIATPSATPYDNGLPRFIIWSSADSSNAHEIDECYFEYQEQGNMSLVEGYCLVVDYGPIVLTASPLTWMGNAISGYESPAYESIAGMKVELADGKYICGVDLPAGRYIATPSATSYDNGLPRYFVWSSADSSNAYNISECNLEYQEQSSMSLVEGYCVEVQNGPIVFTASPLTWTGNDKSDYESPAYENIVGKKAELAEGKYICGITFPAGTYTITPSDKCSDISASGYTLCSLPDGTYDSILSYGKFDSNESFGLTLKEGNCLEVLHGPISIAATPIEWTN